jgi:hypothetical protein
MHTCIHAYIHAYVYTYIHTHTHAYIHTSTHTSHRRSTTDVWMLTRKKRHADCVAVSVVDPSKTKLCVCVRERE